MKNKNMQIRDIKIKYSQIIKVIALSLILITSMGIALAWTGPTNEPPLDNLLPPINTSNESQTKDGYLSVPALFDANEGQTGYYVDPGENSWLYRLYSYDIRSSIFYDQDDTNYYANPAGTSKFGSIDATGTICDSGGCIGDGGDSLWTESGSNVYRSSGNVGIGTTEPGYKLEVDGTTYFGGASIFDIGRGAVYLESNANDNSDGAGITLRTSLNPTGAGGSIFAVRSSGQATRLWVGQSFSSSGCNDFYVGSSVSATANDTSLYSAKIARSGDSYFNGGNVGIGTTEPGQKLDVSGNIKANGELISTRTSANNARFIAGNYGVIHRNDGTNYYVLLTAFGDQYGSWNSLRPFRINDASGDVMLGNNAFYVQHAGNVGIGDTTPSYKLGTGRRLGSWQI